MPRLLIALILTTSLVAAERVGEVVAPLATAFPLEAVRLLDSPFRAAMERDGAYLLSLDVDRLLHTFRLNAGLPSTATPLGGWEKPGCELRGHFIGHYLSACALMFAASGDARFQERARAIVAGLAEVQAALPAKSMHPGYLSAFPESLLDRFEACKPVWAPWYTLHKLHAGLLDAYRCCHDPQALEVASRFAAWVRIRQDALDGAARQRAIDHNEIGGIGESMADTAAITGDPAELRTAASFDHRRLFDPLATGDARHLDGMHANTQIPKILAAAREYELTGDQAYRRTVETFWQSVAIDRAYAIGGHSDHEHFFPLADFAKHLGPETCETCNTYNMLKLTRHLFAWAPSARYMDFYERALYNHILASQNPATGMIVYLMSLKPGHFKTYSTPLDSFWCCLGTGVENHAKYADSVYFHGTDALWINLFIPSELAWKERGVTVRQATAFPASPSTHLTLNCTTPQRFTLHIRHPAWAVAGFAITVNGTAVADASQPGSYASVEREWRDGDQVAVTLPMRLTSEPLPGDARTVAFLYGPLVLAGTMGKADLPAGFDFQAKGQCDYSRMPSPQPSVLLADDAATAIAHLKPAAAPLSWRSEGLGRPEEITLIPFHQVHEQRYTVYWQMLDQAGLAAHDAARASEERHRSEAVRLQKARAARLIDRVAMDDPQAEKAHGLQADGSHSGTYNGRAYRDGKAFSYQLVVKPGVAQVLLCTWWGGDHGRSFDILVDDHLLTTVTLAAARPGEFIEAEYPLPVELLTGRTQIRVRFQAHPGSIAGGLFGCEMLNADTP